MATENDKRFVLMVGSEEEPIKMLLSLLSGRVFDFQYKLARNGKVANVVKNVMLSTRTCFLSPIKLERRGQGDRCREYLVFVVDDEDDLLVSVSNWEGKLRIDFCEVEKGVITITNHEGDRYRFIIHDTKKEL